MKRLITIGAILLVFGGIPASAMPSDPSPEVCWFYRQWAMDSYAKERRVLRLVEEGGHRNRVTQLLKEISEEGYEYEMGSLACKALVLPKGERDVLDRLFRRSILG